MNISLEDIPPSYDMAYVKARLGDNVPMSDDYIAFLTQNPSFRRLMWEIQLEGKIEGQIEAMLDFLQRHFTASLAELVEQALDGVRDMDVIDQFAHVTYDLDEQRIQMWAQAYAAKDPLAQQLLRNPKREELIRWQVKSKVETIAKFLHVHFPDVPSLVNEIVSNLSQIKSLSLMEEIETFAFTIDDIPTLYAVADQYASSANIPSRL